MTSMATGEIVCPKCKKGFILDKKEQGKKIEVVCPNCNNRFTASYECSTVNSKEECSWIEHGEPRKTILSSNNQKTNMTTIAAILLICVFLIGIATSIYSESFQTTTLEIITAAGVKGSVRILVIDELNNTIENASININNKIFYTNVNGIFYSGNIDLGFKAIRISNSSYKTQTYEIMVNPFGSSEITVKLEEGTGIGKTIEYDITSFSMILVIFSVFSLFGAITSFMRKYLDGAIFCSCIGFFSFGFFFIGSIISIIAILIIWSVKDEFDNEEKGKVF